MLVAVSADGKDLSGAVSEKFETCRYLLIVETDDMSFDVFKNAEDAESLAGTVVGRDCEAVITGSFTPEIFNIIADACITRYGAAGLSVRDSIERMDRNTLEYIRYANEDDTCHGEHGGGECNCGEDD
jgi:predicted Fe-Mo cluster-binding NifX family protein